MSEKETSATDVTQTQLAIHSDQIEKDEILKYISVSTEKISQRSGLRKKNDEAASKRPDESVFTKLDSSLKKNSAFVKKLKNLSEAQKDSIENDFKSLNLTKYIGEVASAIVEAKIKISDIPFAANVCSLLHQRYAEFSSALFENWQRAFAFKKDDKVTNLSKLRVDLRFYTELITVGVLTGKECLTLLSTVLHTLITNDKDEHNYINILINFCRHCGEDYVGLVPRRIRSLADKHGFDLPSSSKMMSPERQKSMQGLLKEYYGSAWGHLENDHKEMQEMDRQNRKLLQTKGELSSDRREKLEMAQIAYQKLFASVQQFADCLDVDFAEIIGEVMTLEPEDVVNLEFYTRLTKSDVNFDPEASLWEDEDTKCFYENLYDLKPIIPGILIKDSSQQTAPSAADSESKTSDDLLLLDIDDDCETKSGLDDEEVLPPVLPDEQEEAGPSAQESTTNVSNKVLLEAFLTRIPQCVNRDLIDKAAHEFCMTLNTRSNRKKLSRTLFLVPRTRLDLLPFYSRLVATLNPCMPDLAVELANLLKQDFKYHFKKKDQINIESKIKNVRFIGEMVKFGMYAKNEALFCLKLLLLDFSHHHIDMACNLLEVCGRFLYRSPDSHHKTKLFLEQIMRKKSVMALDSRYVTMIENAYYYSNPPEAQQSVSKERPPMHEYVRKLIFRDLDRTTVEKVLKQIRKLDWGDEDTSSYVIKCMITAIWNVKYLNIKNVANLLAGLVLYQEKVGIVVVDSILEDIRLGMEINHPKFNQRRVGAVKYLGELYNYRLVESAVIFKILYSFITYGVCFDPDGYSAIDPPDNLFRIRLVCVLLETCGQYFDSGPSKKKLDYFLTYFQRYYLMKKSLPAWDVSQHGQPFPISCEYQVKDTLTVLRPKMVLFETLIKAEQAIKESEKELLTKLADSHPQFKVLLNQNEEVSKGSPDPTIGGLHKISETDEDDISDVKSADESDAIISDVIPEEDEDEDDDEDSYNRGGTGDSRSQPFGEDGEGERDNDDGESELTDEAAAKTTMGGEDAYVRAGIKHLKCAEDDDFMTAFDKMLSENVQSRSQELVKPQNDLTIPYYVKANLNQKKTTFVGMAAVTTDSHGSCSPTIDLSEEGDGLGNNSATVNSGGTMNFALLVRKGNKSNFKCMQVPVTSELALNLKDRTEAEKAEKERVKRLTLDINERQEMEDYQELVASLQRPALVVAGRRFQHTKGAPDADSIFGTKNRDGLSLRWGRMKRNQIEHRLQMQIMDDTFGSKG